MISSKKFVDETLKKHNLNANKSLGQNILCEESVSKQIVNALQDISKSVVIEIGPGLGALSEFILPKAFKTIIYEIDKNMCDIFKDTFEEYTNYELFNEDILNVDLIKEISKYKDLDVKVVSNLPYYITSQILSKLLIANCKTIVVMMQKEVANKLIH